MKRSMKMLSRIVFMVMAVALVLGVAMGAQPMAAASPLAVNQTVVEKYFGEVLSAADKVATEEILAPEFQRIDRSTFGVTLGAPGTMFLADYLHRSFANLDYTIDAIVIEGDQAAVCWTASGEHTAAYGAAEATGKPVVWTGMSFVQLRDGKIVSEMTNLENLSELLGAQELRISPSYAQ